MFADATSTQYNSAISQFTKWGGYMPCQSDVVLDYIVNRGSLETVDRLKVSSLKVHLAAISKWHLSDNWDDPTKCVKIKSALNRLVSLERQNGIRKSNSRFITPHEASMVVNVLMEMKGTLKARRDRLMMALSIVCGPRAGMLAGLKVEDLVNLSLPGIEIIINAPAFKTENETPTYIPYSGQGFCPATWLREYVIETGITEGYVFKGTQNDYGKPLSRQTVNSVIKSILKSAGVNIGKLTSHTFRKTMASLAAMEGVSVVDIAAQGSWSSIDTVNKDYITKSIALLGNAPKAVMNSIARAGGLNGSNQIDSSTMSLPHPNEIAGLSDAECQVLMVKLMDRLQGTE